MLYTVCGTSATTYGNVSAFVMDRRNAFANVFHRWCDCVRARVCARVCARAPECACMMARKRAFTGGYPGVYLPVCAFMCTDAFIVLASVCHGGPIFREGGHVGLCMSVRMHGTGTCRYVFMHACSMGPFKCYVAQYGVGGCQISWGKALRSCTDQRY